MRRQLLVAVMSLLVAATVTFAVPLALAVRSTLTDRALDELQAQAAQVAFVLSDQGFTTFIEGEILRVGADRGGVSLATYTFNGRQLIQASRSGVVLDPGTTLVEAGRVGIARERGGDRLRVALLLNGQRIVGDQILYAEAGVADLDASVRRSWLGLAALSLLVLGGGGVATWRLGNRLGRPLEELAGAATAIGDGDFTRRAPRSGLPEPDAIAAALDDTAERLGDAVQRSQAFAADASHQLRTPLTALQLHLDTVALRAPDDEDVAAALGQAERLGNTIDELVSLTRLDTTATAVELGEVVERVLRTFQQRVADAGREVVLRAAETEPVHVRPGAISQALQVLLDNALEHGVGRIAVLVEPVAEAVRIVVIDQGPGVGPAVADRVNSGTGVDRTHLATVRGGRGLELARTLVEAEGGRLRVEKRDEGTHAMLLVPRARPARMKTP